MTDTKTKRIHVLHGPYAGQALDVASDVAEQAIKDGWAKDPFAPPEPQPKEGQPVKEETEEQRLKAKEAAEKAAPKLRGEPEKKDMHAGEPAGSNYTTREQASGKQAQKK